MMSTSVLDPPLMDMRSFHLWRGMRHTEASRIAICSCWSPFIVMITGIIRMFNRQCFALFILCKQYFYDFMWYTVVYHGITYTPYTNCAFLKAESMVVCQHRCSWSGMERSCAGEWSHWTLAIQGTLKNGKLWWILRPQMRDFYGFFSNRSCLNKKFHQNTSKLTLFEEDLEVGELVSFTRHCDNWEYGTEQHPVWNHGKTQFWTS